MYIIVGARQAKPEHREALIKGFIEQARNCVDKEPGCVAFNVIQDTSDINRVWLYEVFKDEAAFKAHTQMEHTRKFHEISDPWREPPPVNAVCQNIWPGDGEWPSSK